MKFVPVSLLIAMVVCTPSIAQQPTGREDRSARCEIVPLANHQVSMRIDGIEKTRWHFGEQYPRPFFFPFNGPSGESLTRMGHPGAPNHDHHRSVWFAHAKLAGVDFWSDNTKARVKQSQWLAYIDGDDEAIMASRLDWHDAEGRNLMQQELVAALMPIGDGEHALEFQLTFRPANGESVELEQTNFGLLAVRVAKSISTYFGGGTITSSEGFQNEAHIFGKQARRMDYSGSVSVGQGEQRKQAREGITFFDHPANPRYPTYWHVREDGWMGASFGMHAAHTITADDPLVLRYLLHAHRGRYDSERAARVAEAFAERPGFEVAKSKRKHISWEVLRK